MRGGGVNFTKEFLLNEISKFCSKKWGEGQFYKRNPFRPTFWKAQNFAQKSVGGLILSKEIPLNEISEILKISLKND